MPTKKPRISITIEISEKERISQLAERFGYTESGLCSHIVRSFLSNYDDGSLPKIGKEYYAQLKMDLK